LASRTTFYAGSTACTIPANPRELFRLGKSSRLAGVLLAGLNTAHGKVPAPVRRQTAPWDCPETLAGLPRTFHNADSALLRCSMARCGRLLLWVLPHSRCKPRPQPACKRLTALKLPRLRSPDACTSAAETIGPESGRLLNGLRCSQSCCLHRECGRTLLWCRACRPVSSPAASATPLPVVNPQRRQQKLASWLHVLDQEVLCLSTTLGRR